MTALQPTLRAQLPIVHVARICLEAASPLSIGSGRSDALFDSPVVRDANDLPALPGSSLAGVLRAAVRESAGADFAQALFGHAGRSLADGAASRVQVSWGRIHAADDVPVDGLVTDDRLLRDELLGPLLRADLPKRDHVRLGHRGTGETAGKFDRSYVPAGHRFSFEMQLACATEADEAAWAQLLMSLGSASLRLGGATRRGFGRLLIVRLESGRFDLRVADDLNRYSALPTRLDFSASRLLAPKAAPSNAVGPWESVSVTLTPEDYWRVGGGAHPFAPGDKPADMLPASEKRVVWQNGKGRLSAKPAVVVPASAIKGALAHRLAFHFNRLVGRFAGAISPHEPNPAVAAVFGTVKQDDASAEGHRGNVLIDDIVPDPKTIRPQVLMHNSIDRFTGGTRNGVLFGEEMLYGGELKLMMQIDTQGIAQASGDLQPQVEQALAATLHDLCTGQLALGAAQARGHGFMRGVINDAPEWLRSKQ
ncbi:RAMP superfamily CRISPR-associated protein [Niveibacterium sp. COAC-50]|uniref:RAMP superfamily CRISPR-associated protein n=1 Tax=Niveibacterium sp. COAC-50 TaxID=2729384 RepID=UPI001558026C|nr:RAMP superfamily CRISPR-associated protein [Niveibacterium sp. COAC-50]